MDFNNLVRKKLPELSKSQQQIAKYVLENLSEAAFETASQLGKKNGKSETSVIRFAYSLGYSSFSEMNNAMKESVLKKTNNGHRSICQSDQLLKLAPEQASELFEKTVTNYSEAFSNINFNDFVEICDLIMTKKKILIIGYMDSFGVASELLHVLDKLRTDVYFFRLLIEERNMLYKMDEDSLVITISFEPHYKYSLEHTMTAKKGGCKLITISDNLLNPYNQLADYSLIFNLDRNKQIDLIDTSPVSQFIYFMINYLNAKYHNEVEEYRHSMKLRVEQYLD